MRLGVNTLIWTAQFGLEHLPLFETIQQHGFDGVEVAGFHFRDFPAREVKATAGALGLDLILCSALTGTLSLASEDAAVRQTTCDFLRIACDTAVAIGTDTLVGPFCTPVGYLPGRRRNAGEWQRVVEGLQSVMPHFEQAGVKMAIEPLNRFETYFLNTTADAVRLCEEVGSPNVGILFDTFHAHIEEKSTRDALVAAGKRLFHVHTCENDRGAPGSGQVHWQGVKEGLAAASYEGWCVIESFGFSIKEIAAAACIWRDLAPSPDEIAWEGAKFLRRLLG